MRESVASNSGGIGCTVEAADVPTPALVDGSREEGGVDTPLSACISRFCQHSNISSRTLTMMLNVRIFVLVGTADKRD